VITYIQDRRALRKIKAAYEAGSDGVELPPERGARLSRQGPYIPRDREQSLLQSALLQDALNKRDEGALTLVPTRPRDADPCAANGPLPSAALSADERLAGPMGEYDLRWLQTVGRALITAWVAGPEPFGDGPVADFPLAPDARVLLVSDWGTGLHGALQVADQICGYVNEAEARQVHVIHLGDVYYCGTPREYERHLLAPWPERLADREHLHFWNMNGNHDMYSGGQGYFSLLRGNADADSLAADARRKLFAAQGGRSYFRLANEHWQLLGLDTAYEDRDLGAEQLGWLKGHLRAARGPRAQRSIVLSHHQLDSVHERADVGTAIGRKLEQELRDGLIDVWFWGHEHRCIQYKPFRGVRYPRCIGHGGVPQVVEPTVVSVVRRLVSTARALFQQRNVSLPPRIDSEFTDSWQADDGLHWRKHGFVCLDLDGARASVKYVDQCGDATWAPESWGPESF
jgi:hypothetical protein